MIKHILATTLFLLLPLAAQSADITYIVHDQATPPLACPPMEPDITHVITMNWKFVVISETQPTSLVLKAELLEGTTVLSAFPVGGYVNPIKNLGNDKWEISGSSSLSYTPTSSQSGSALTLEQTLEWRSGTTPAQQVTATDTGTLTVL